MTNSLAELGEAELLSRLARFAPPGQFSNDTATLPSDSRPLLVNTDVLVENVHFSEATTSPEDVGWRAVAANLSDLAASGAIEVDGITVALVAPGSTPWSWVEGVYKGLTKALDRFGGVLLGGDCSRGVQRSLSITALGRLSDLHLHRGDAHPGDALVTSGVHGLSRLGLALLQNDPDLDGLSLAEDLKQASITQHQRPIPRLDALNALLKTKPSHQPWRAGGTDSSDGLLAAVEGLCASSRCGALLDREQMPRPHGWPAGTHWDHWCLSGGEDFELVLSLPQDWAERWLTTQPGSVRLGTITAEDGVIRWRHDRSPISQPSFNHYDKP